jgi:hypothetical protein|eukprot:g4601.t1
MNSLRWTASVVVCAFVALSSCASAATLRAPITPYKYRQLGFKKLGSGYWKRDWDFFYAKIKQSDPKSWTKLDTPNLKVLGAGYAIMPHSVSRTGGKAFFKGQEFASTRPGMRANGLKVLRSPDGKPSFWAVGKTGTIFYKGRRNNGVDGHKVKLIGHGWAQISGRAYYHGNRVRGAAGKVTPHGPHYATDAIHGYFKGKRIDIAGQASTFKLLGGDYAGTQMFAFYNGEKVGQCVNPEKVMGGYLICMGGRVFYQGKPVSTAKCINPKKDLGHGFLECFTTYLHNGEKLNGPSPQHNRLEMHGDGTAVDKRGKEYGTSIELEEEDKKETKKDGGYDASAKSKESLFGGPAHDLRHLFE